MRHPLLFAGAALGAAILLAQPASATVTYVKSDFSASATAQPGNHGESDTITSNSLPTNTLSENRSGFAGPNSANATATASFTDVTGGALTVSNLKAAAEGEGPPNIGQTGYATASTSLYYDFTIDSSYLARITYDLTADPGSSFSYSIYPVGGSSSAVSHALSSGQGFIFSDPFGPGAYTLRIGGSVSAQSYPGDPSVSRSASGSVAFQLIPNGRPGSPTPEPASWALMISGFGLVGAALRRRAVAA